MRVGYARVSRKDQRLEPQGDALLADGCERVFKEKVPSREVEREALREAIDYCREGDVLVVARLDRLGRSLRADRSSGELEGRGVGFRSLKESLDTTTSRELPARGSSSRTSAHPTVSYASSQTIEGETTDGT